MKKANTTPLETEECITLAQYLTHKRVLFTHLAQETFTKSWNQKRKNKAMGVNSGFPDYAIYIAPHQSSNGQSKTIFIEMKRQKGGVVSKEQKQWIDGLIDSGIIVYVCRGFDEAQSVLENHLL